MQGYIEHRDGQLQKSANLLRPIEGLLEIQLPAATGTQITIILCAAGKMLELCHSVNKSELV